MSGLTSAQNVADRRDQILESTWQLIAQRGYNHVRVQDVARMCGTSTGTVHYYFPGKVDVLREALRYCVDQAFERQGATLRGIDDAHKRLLALIEMQLPVGNQVRDEWSIWLQFWSETALNLELRPTHNDFYTRWMDTVIRIVHRGQRQGIFRNVDAAEFALLFTSVTDGVAIKILTGVPGVSVESMRRMLVSIIDKELSMVPGAI